MAVGRRQRGRPRPGTAKTPAPHPDPLPAPRGEGEEKKNGEKARAVPPHGAHVPSPRAAGRGRSGAHVPSPRGAAVWERVRVRGPPTESGGSPCPLAPRSGSVGEGQGEGAAD